MFKTIRHNYNLLKPYITYFLTSTDYGFDKIKATYLGSNVKSLIKHKDSVNVYGSVAHVFTLHDQAAHNSYVRFLHNNGVRQEFIDVLQENNLYVASMYDSFQLPLSELVY